MTVNTKLNLYEYVAAVQEIANEYFDEEGNYRPHYGILNAMRVFYNMCVRISKFDGVLPHDFVDLSQVEQLAADDEFIDEFNAALIADRIDTSFANAYRDAQEIVEYRKHSVGNIIDILKVQFNKLLAEIGAVDVNELVTTVKNGDVDKLISKYGESERFKEVVAEKPDEEIETKEDISDKVEDPAAAVVELPVEEPADEVIGELRNVSPLGSFIAGHKSKVDDVNENN